MELDPGDTWTLDMSLRAGGTLVLRSLDDACPTDELALGEVTPSAPVRFAVLEGFTGWSTFAIDVVGRSAAELRGHRGLVVTGRSGPIDESRSQRVVLPPHGPGLQPLPHLQGLFPTAWDGSDVFTPKGTWHVCVSGRVRDAVLAAGLVGVAFTRLTAWAVLDVDG